MRFLRSANDPVLKRFLSAKDVAESARQLATLLADYAEARIKNIIMARLRYYFNNYEHHPDFEDLCSEVKTKLVTYLEELKVAPTARPCKDFRSYVAAITHNACNDYLRQIYPARTRLYKQVRDLLRAHPDFAIWKTKDEFKVYMLYARDVAGEDLITLFLAAKIVTASQIADQLDLSMDQFQDLLLTKLPLDNESIAEELGIKVERVYKLRFQAGKRLKVLLSRTKIKI